jgi:hypothetical protein
MRDYVSMEEHVDIVAELRTQIAKLEAELTRLKRAAHDAGAASRRSEDENEAYRNAMTDAGRGHLLR